MDLFTTDRTSRINLEPSKKWNAWIQGAFKEGRCECQRCRDNDFDQTTFPHLHTFEVDGQVISRRFAITSKEDLETLLKNAWISFYNLNEEESSDFKNNGSKEPLSFDMIKSFTIPPVHSRLELLLNIIQGVRLVDDNVHLVESSL